jgi:hypothetical protein
MAGLMAAPWDGGWRSCISAAGIAKIATNDAGITSW